jgi:signal transduction histidine kinase
MHQSLAALNGQSRTSAPSSKEKTVANGTCVTGIHFGPAKSRITGLLTLLLIPVIGVGYYAVETEISLAVFYLPPLAMAAWFGGRVFCCFAAIETAIVWFAADEARMTGSPSTATHHWSLLIRLLIYTAIATLIAFLREHRDELERDVQRKAARLKAEIANRTRAEREILQISNREQQRFAHDLHDGLGQQLAALALRAKLLEQKLNGAEISGEATAMVALIKEAARQTRMIAKTLNITGLGDLDAAFQKLAASITNIRVHYQNEIDPTHSISPVVAMNLYRIAQEAVHNAVEHAAGTQVQVHLSSEDGELVLRLRDDGRGFDSSRGSNGMGLRLMQYRAHRAGGWCSVSSQPGQGTSITCRVPFSKASVIAA